MPKGEAINMLNIAVSSRSLAAARAVDPDVSPAAVRAAVEAALAEVMRQLGRQSDGALRSTQQRRQG
jgi:post-segregation antitoxin (ccd killing protein)